MNPVQYKLVLLVYILLLRRGIEDVWGNSSSCPDSSPPSLPLTCKHIQSTLVGSTERTEYSSFTHPGSSSSAPLTCWPIHMYRAEDIERAPFTRSGSSPPSLDCWHTRKAAYNTLG